MAKFVGFLLALSTALTAEAKMPEDFLQVESAAWNSWLDEEMNVHWHGVSLEHALEDEFGAAMITVDNAADLQTPITFNAVGRSRRTVLWRLSKRHNITFHWKQKEEPRIFLGILETERRKRSIGGVTVTTMTAVMRSDPETYQKHKEAEQIAKEKKVGDTTYYSIDINRDLPFENGATAWFTVVERYKVVSRK